MVQVILRASMDIVDTHLHIIDHRRLSYPWVGNYRQLSGNYLYETYSAQALSLGIARTLPMEVDVPLEQIEDEAQMAEDLRRDLGPPMVGAVISCRPEDPEFPAFLDRQLRRPHIRGLRRVLHVAPDDISRGYLFRKRRLAATGLPSDVCVFARQWGLAAELAAACPNTRFVLDHCGQPEIALGTGSRGVRRSSILRGGRISPSRFPASPPMRARSIGTRRTSTDSRGCCNLFDATPSLAGTRDDRKRF
jgi:predicted TIM-barrel fold metal-dependent hydrolase